MSESSCAKDYYLNLRSTYSSATNKRSYTDSPHAWKLIVTLKFTSWGLLWCDAV